MLHFNKGTIVQKYLLSLPLYKICLLRVSILANALRTWNLSKTLPLVRHYLHIVKR